MLNKLGIKLPDFRSLLAAKEVNLNDAFLAAVSEDKKISKIQFVAIGDIFPLNAADMVKVRVSPDKTGKPFEIILDDRGWFANKAVMEGGREIDVLFSAKALKDMIADGMIVVRKFV